MTGPEHYREAERLVQLAMDENSVSPFADLQAAQVHATLALTAATAGQTAVNAFHYDIGSRDVEEWADALAREDDTR